MLILTRYIGQNIIMTLADGNTTIDLSVLDVTGKQVKLGIAAPKDINIVREELLYKKNNNNNVFSKE